MSRPLFGMGSRGALIEQLQTALQGKGFDPKATDGRFGNDTAAAVTAFQTAAATAPATGVVSDDDWTAITETAVPDVEARSLQLTSTFEGHGFTLAQGNWDGAWLTWGIIGFTLKHGEVQAIVENVNASAPDCVQRAFGADADKLLEIVGAAPDEQEAWANSITAGSALAEPWRTNFATFGSFPEVQAEQCRRVHADYFSPAIQHALTLGLRSELGIALAFDIQVQNGGVSAHVRDTVLAATSGQDEAVVREALANAVADNAKPQFRDDVRARKLTIARGQGSVHGRAFALENWGLSGGQIVAIG